MRPGPTHPPIHPLTHPPNHPTTQPPNHPTTQPPNHPTTHPPTSKVMSDLLNSFLTLQSPPVSPDGLAEQVVAMQPEHREVSHVIKLQRDHDRLPSNRVILPPDPLVTLLSDPIDVQSEVIDPLLPVDQLTHSSGEEAVLDEAIVGDIVKVNIAATRVTLRHAVRHDSVWNDENKMTASKCFIQFFFLTHSRFEKPSTW